MCMEDIRIMRKTSVRVRQITIPAGEFFRLAPDKHRVAITVQETGGVQCLAMPDATTGTVIGFALQNLNSDAPIHTFDLMRHGALVTTSWAFSGGGAAPTIVIAETFLHEE